MQDIADALGISRATVSNALRGKGRLSVDTAKQVHEMAQKLNFVPSSLGRALRTGRSASIGLIVPDFRMPLFAEFARAFAMAARARNMVLTIADSLGDRAEQSRHLLELSMRGLDALAIIPLRGTPADELIAPRTLVVIDAASNPKNSISSDHYAGGQMMAAHLVALGHRKILVLHGGGAEDARGGSHVNDQRRAGLIAALQAAGVAYQEASMPARFETARDFIATWQPGDITAIAATYDAMAVGVLNALHHRGIAVPAQISVAGFDDTVLGQITAPDLSTMRQDLDALAEAAFDIALGQTDPGRLIPFSLVQRGSTGPAPTHALLSPSSSSNDRN